MTQPDYQPAIPHLHEEEIQLKTVFEVISYIVGIPILLFFWWYGYCSHPFVQLYS